MSHKKIIIEQSDDEPEDLNNYVPGRGEAFQMGLLQGCNELAKSLPRTLIIILLFFLILIVIC